MGKDSSVYQGFPSDIRAKSFLHAISEIEQLSAVEYRTDLPDGVVPLLARFTFWDVPAKTAFVTTLYTFLTAPFCMAVFDRILPVFGETNPSLMDRVFSWLLSAAPALGMGLLIVVVLATRVYWGRTTKNLVHSFLISFVGTKVAVSFLLGMIIMYLHYSVFTDEWILNLYRSIAHDRFFPPGLRGPAASFTEWLFEFRRTIPGSVAFSVSVHGGVSLLVFLSYLYCRFKSEKLRAFRQEWE